MSRPTPAFVLPRVFVADGARVAALSESGTAGAVPEDGETARSHEERQCPRECSLGDKSEASRVGAAGSRGGLRGTDPRHRRCDVLARMREFGALLTDYTEAVSRAAPLRTARTLPERSLNPPTGGSKLISSGCAIGANTRVPRVDPGGDLIGTSCRAARALFPFRRSVGRSTAVSRAGAATLLPGEQLGGGLERSAGGSRALGQRFQRRLVSCHWVALEVAGRSAVIVDRAKPRDRHHQRPALAGAIRAAQRRTASSHRGRRAAPHRWPAPRRCCALSGGLGGVGTECGTAANERPPDSRPWRSPPVSAPTRRGTQVPSSHSPR